MLGDKRLQGKDSLAKLKEGNQRLTDSKKIEGQKELEKQERSAGPRMPYQEVIRRIQKLNSQIKVKDGIPGNVALYAPRTGQELSELEEPDPRGDFFTRFKYVGGFSTEPMPEFSHVILDERGLATREYRGWRSVLISLIKAQVLSYQSAVEEFGEPYGPRSSRWFEQLRKYKY